MTHIALPERITGEQHLEQLLSEPTEAAIDALRRIDGDLIVLGAGGKMGPSLARMARRAFEAAGLDRRVIAVSRFSNGDIQRQLQVAGVQTIRGDLLDPTLVDSLPDAAAVVYMAGMKFGATGNLPLTWAMNTHLPALISRRFRASRIVAFSTGNVYPLVPIDSGGCAEDVPPAPVGEYAMSCLGRERMFEYFATALDLPITILRLNYACEMRYGVLVDIALKVHCGQEVSLAMSHVNVIWQADANAMALAAISGAANPPLTLNVAGCERLRVRDVAERFGQLLTKPVKLTGTESPTALLSNGSRGRDLYGPPRVSAEQMMGWVADWIGRGGVVWDR
ncbi:MAG: NAD-dependent epimerase/dehydratase family protein, partial [Planctomycetes bacterium]|nr:NAD-dependent epimerase/dehydratase family protein [Planctomycetota bacterium]